MNFKIVRRRSFYELYISGVYYCSADTFAEALQEYNKYIQERLKTERK